MSAVRRGVCAALVGLAACAHVTPKSNDDAPATSDRAAASKVVVCTTRLSEARALLGAPYRDGSAHGLKVLTWKVDPGDGRRPEPLVIAFDAEGLAVDACFDLPGMVACELAHRCR